MLKLNDVLAQGSTDPLDLPPELLRPARVVLMLAPVSLPAPDIKSPMREEVEGCDFVDKSERSPPRDRRCACPGPALSQRPSGRAACCIGGTRTSRRRDCRRGRR